MHPTPNKSTPSKPTLSYPIYTPRLMLRPFTSTDLEALHVYYSNIHVARYLYWEAMDIQQTQRALLEKTRQQDISNPSDRLSLAVCMTESRTVIGDVSLSVRSHSDRQGEIGFVFNPAYAGKGFATEASQAMLVIAFEKIGLHRVFGRCDVRNKTSCQLMHRLGMRREAHLLENEIFKGEWGSEYIYAILQREWRDIHPQLIKT